jgi:hypothetical protein
MQKPGLFGRALIGFTVLIVADWTYLVCQLFLGFIWFEVCGLREFCRGWGVDRIWGGREEVWAKKMNYQLTAMS